MQTSIKSISKNHSIGTLIELYMKENTDYFNGSVERMISFVNDLTQWKFITIGFNDRTQKPYIVYSDTKFYKLTELFKIDPQYAN
tara:strand:- start:313 stop:567 length:255 start_codon:yes stop_codon:yes gene_type:complete